MNILHIASECAPFCKTGGLADVLGALPKALQNQGIRVSVILPLYKTIPSHFREPMKVVSKCSIQLGWRQQTCQLNEVELDGIHYYFIENDAYFGGEEIYGEITSFHEAERFAFFCKAVLDVLPRLTHKPDVLHAHDWQTALIPYLLKEHFHQDPYYSIPSIFTIHNVKYQGIYPMGTLMDLLDVHEQACEMDGCVNFMKGAIVHADQVTTVSETYAKEIQQPLFGEGLEEIISEHDYKVTGILNGVDETVYDPYADPCLIQHPPTFDWKAANKRYLQAQLDLPVREVPVLAMVTRLVEQKGIGLLLELIEELLTEEDIQLVIVGKGKAAYEEALKKVEANYPSKLSVQIGFFEELARQVYASADLFLMPSQSEPCGLGQLIAFQYEAVPLVRETGGLQDTVQSFNEFTGEGNGFTFAPYKAHDFLFTIRRALHFYGDPVLWWRIVQNIRFTRYNWAKSAYRYTQLYQFMLSQPPQEVKV